MNSLPPRSLSVRVTDFAAPVSTRWDASIRVGNSLEEHGAVHAGYRDSLVSLCVAIAASAAEHVEILCRISAVLVHPTHLDVLRTTEDPGAVTRILQEA